MKTLPLGRRVPTDWKHYEKYPYAAVVERSVKTVEKTLSLPRLRSVYDQGSEGACVGFGSSWVMSILNRHRYDPVWLWNQAKAVDEWPDTNPGDDNGTSVRAAMDILRTQGHVRVLRGNDLPVDLKEGIAANRWAKTIDEVRTSIAAGVPVAIGVNWYTNFDKPTKEGRRHVIGKGELGTIRGGHCVCIYGASDKRQSVLIVNNWGTSYPLVEMPYDTLQRLINEDGEVTVITDR